MNSTSLTKLNLCIFRVNTTAAYFSCAIKWRGFLAITSNCAPEAVIANGRIEPELSNYSSFRKL